MNLADFIYKYRAVFIILAVVLVVVLLFYYGVVYSRPQLDIEVAPEDATVMLNDTIITEGSHHIEPGQYVVTASREGFADYRHQFTMEDDLSLFIGLEPITDEALIYVHRNSQEFLEVEALSGELAREEGEQFRGDNPIVEHLPYRSLIFNIDYRLNDDENIVLIISADGERDRNYALDQIREWGFNPDDFTIEYQSYPD